LGGVARLRVCDLECESEADLIESVTEATDLTGKFSEGGREDGGAPGLDAETRGEELFDMTEETGTA